MKSESVKQKEIWEAIWHRSLIPALFLLPLNTHKPSPLNTIHNVKFMVFISFDTDTTLYKVLPCS